MAASACSGPGLPVTTYEEPPVDVGAVRILSVTDAYGRRVAVASAVDATLAEQATRAAVDELLNEITPTVTTDDVELDDRDEEEKPILESAKDDVTAALEKEQRFLSAHPERAAPRYNHAVMLDHLKDYEAALAGYDDAKRHEPDAELTKLIDEARAGCAERLRVAYALGL